MPPQLPERSNKPPVVRPEWNIELPRGDMDQVDELLDTIAAHKEMGETGASVMFFFFKRRVQPIQQRHILGFKYMYVSARRRWRGSGVRRGWRWEKGKLTGSHSSVAWAVEKG
jgi:hypothetical protein